MNTLDRLNALLDPVSRTVEGKGYEFLQTIKAVECANGLKLSIQTSRSHYCAPRDDRGPWHEVEVGFPTARVEKLMPYAEDAEKPTETVYAWVPIDVVVEVIDDNGGIK